MRSSCRPAAGQTLERLVVDLTGGMFSTGQLYVALSRCASLAGLVLKRPVLRKDLKTDRRIARFLRTSVQDSGARRYCAIGMLTVATRGVCHGRGRWNSRSPSTTARR